MDRTWWSLVAEGIGWEAVFFVNVPIGIAGVALTLARAEESSKVVDRRRTGPMLDLRLFRVADFQRAAVRAIGPRPAFARA